MRRSLPRLPGSRAIQAGIPVAALLMLAACSGNPEKDTPPTAGAGTARPAAATADDRRVSPYAPAQEDLSKRGNYTAGGLYAPGVRDSAPDELPRVDLIPEPVPRAEPRSRYGNRSPYTVLGKQYRVLDSAEGYVGRGIASYYGQKFHGRRTSSLEVYDMYTFSAAHKSLPLPSYARVTNLENGKSVVVRVNDRGPFHEGRIIDLSYAAAVKLGIHRSGTAQVEVRALTPGDASPAEPARHVPAGSAVAQAPATGKPRPASAMDALVAGLPDAPAAVAAPTPATTVVAALPGPIATQPAGREWRFDMRRDGRTMTADEFDAWMRARGARVATGKPGKPSPPAAAVAGMLAAADVGPPARASAMPAGAVQPDAIPTNTMPSSATPVSASDSPDGPVRTASAVVGAGGPAPIAVAAGSAAAPAADAVVLQVASFAGHDNALRALAMVRGAGIGQARLLDAVVNGRQVWRLRIGPVDDAAVANLSARVTGLGFGPPQVVRGR